MPHPNPNPHIQNTNTARADEDIAAAEVLGWDGDSVRLYQDGDTLAGISVSAEKSGGLVDYQRGGVCTLRVAGQVRRGDEIGIAPGATTPVAKPAAGLVIGMALSDLDAGGYIQCESWRFGEAVGFSGSYNDLGNPPSIPSSLTALDDVAASPAPTEDQVLTWNGTKYAPADAQGGGGAVDSVNGQTGEVQLDAEDVPFDATNTGLVEEVDDGNGGTTTQPVADVQAAIVAVSNRPGGQRSIPLDGAPNLDVSSSGSGHPWTTDELLVGFARRRELTATEVNDTIADPAGLVQRCRDLGWLVDGKAILPVWFSTKGSGADVILPGGPTLSPERLTCLLLAVAEDGALFGGPQGQPMAVFFDSGMGQGASL